MAIMDIEGGIPVTGQFGAQVLDYAGVPPKDVIRVKDPFSIKCTWHIDGAVATSLGGEWSVQVALRSEGTGPGFLSNAITVPLTGQTGATTPYTVTFTFPAGDFFPGGTTRKVPAGQNAEPYQVTAMLASKDLLGKPGLMSASVNLEEVTLFA